MVLLGLAPLTMTVFGILDGAFGWEWLFLAVTPLLWILGQAVARYQSATQLDPYLKRTALATLLMVILFVIGSLV
jgi:1,4-dihydroxy-2-naphthoate octaprenyltransferase